MRILVTGRNGQLGWELERRLADIGEVTALGRDALDLSDLGALAATLERLRPDLVVNAAAYTAVDRAESEPDAAFRVNAQAPEAIAKTCARLGAALVHFSTDYVFDGTKPGRYVEDDPTAPPNVYGRSKLEGEQAIAASGAAAVVLRTTWVYGEHGGNFAKTMLRLATERESLRVVADQRGTPTWTGRLAEAVGRMALQAQGLGPGEAGGVLDWFAARAGLYHASAAGETTWHEYARTVIATAAEDPAMRARLKLSADDVEPIPSSAYPTPAARPMNSLLDCSRLARTFGIAFPDWREDVVACVRRMVAAGG